MTSSWTGTELLLGERWIELGSIWKVEARRASVHLTEVYDAYLNVYSSNVTARKCSGTVKAPSF